MQQVLVGVEMRRSNLARANIKANAFLLFLHRLETSSTHKITLFLTVHGRTAIKSVDAEDVHHTHGVALADLYTGVAQWRESRRAVRLTGTEVLEV